MRCPNCGREANRLPTGICPRCYQYRRIHGRDRPPVADNLYAERGRSGADNAAWKGDAAGDAAKRTRARRRYPLGPCENCGQPADDRHHRDGDVGNNARENIAILCRYCHMEADGRLSRMGQLKNPDQMREP